MNQTTRRQHLATSKRYNLRPDAAVVQPAHVLATAVREDPSAEAVRVNTARCRGVRGKGIASQTLARPVT
jgi:hypothetical protein